MRYAHLLIPLASPVLIPLLHYLTVYFSTKYTSNDIWLHGMSYTSNPPISLPVLCRTTANSNILDSPVSATPAPPHPSSTHTMAIHDQLANRQAEWADTVMGGIPALDMIMDL